MKETCIICDGDIAVDRSGWRHGHNAMPVRQGRCCGECNALVVVPMRIRKMRAGAPMSVNPKQLPLDYDKLW